MRDIDILKDALKKIKCNFTSEKTLIGYTITIYANKSKCLDYEFDYNGNFLRVI